jgi:hypothetical protein
MAIREPRGVLAAQAQRTKIAQAWPKLRDLAQHFDCKILIRFLKLAHNFGQPCTIFVKGRAGAVVVEPEEVTRAAQRRGLRPAL